MLVMITKGPGRGDVFDVGEDDRRDDELAALARRAIADGNACRVDRPTERRIVIHGDAPLKSRPQRPAPPTTSPPINGLVGIHAPPAPIFRRAATTHNAAIVQTSRASQSTAIVTQSRADTALASPAPPQQQPRMSPGLWRWMPVVVVAVLTLMVAAQGASYLRMQESIDVLRGELAKRETAARAELVDQIGRQVRDGSEAQRASLVQGVGDLLASQRESQRGELRQLIGENQEAQVRLNEQIRAALAEQQATMNASLAKLRAEQAAARRQALADRSRQTSAAPSPAPWTSILRGVADAFVSSSTPTAAATTAAPEAIFFVDESGDLAFATSQVRDEIGRELVKLDARRPARLMIFRPDHPFIDVPATMLDQGLAEQTSSATSDVAESDAVAPASLHDALDIAAAAHPHQLFILSDRLGDGSDFDRRALRQALGNQNHGGEMRIHALQFFASDARETMRAIARENGGTYSFVPRG